jgi:hypothetical protein
MYLKLSLFCNKGDYHCLTRQYLHNRRQMKRNSRAGVHQLFDLDYKIIPRIDI